MESMASRWRPTAAIFWSMRFMTVSECASAEVAVEPRSTRAVDEAIGQGGEISSKDSSWGVGLPVALSVGIALRVGAQFISEALLWQRAAKRCGADPPAVPVSGTDPEFVPQTVVPATIVSVHTRGFRSGLRGMDAENTAMSDVGGSEKRTNSSAVGCVWSVEL
ncbi:hypothetical protein NDU88_004222 [Pleurodeles waltl]|uniref:Secreted protein n=1 Tax=Pleurodeles waltl TaxID=8319 RepID=A0AAV7QBA6_PLEWA|nr:hypothetical protein NDU88_004222 [Pleurodeles waltl]